MQFIHPGRILRREMAERGLSANALALALRTPSGRITDILNGKRGVSPETALRLGRYFGNSARFWLNLQTAFELARAESEIGSRIAAEVAPAPIGAKCSSTTVSYSRLNLHRRGKVTLAEGFSPPAKRHIASICTRSILRRSPMRRLMS